MNAETSARRVAGHVLMSKALGWDLAGAKDVGQTIPGPFIVRWKPLKYPSVEDRFAEVFVTLAGPIASGELSAPGDVDVAHARTLLGGDGCLVEFVATVEAVLARHKAALDALVAIFQIGFVSDADVDEAIEAVDRDLVGSITHTRALLPVHVPGSKAGPGSPN